ncbi:MAG: transcription-repair coupling factor [Bacteroidales bacterium]|nr:transcription-repair coupling factor [Candidatus Cacconaster merdequi]
MKFRKEDSVVRDEIEKVLFNNNFHKVDFVVQPGEFALRGGIVDIFSYSDNLPYRIEFFGNEIESVRRFNPDNQLSESYEIESADIYPDLDDNYAPEDYVSFSSMIPSDAVIWDLRDSDGKTYDSDISPQPVFNKNFEILSSDITARQSEGFVVTILSPNDSQTLRLKQIMRDIGVTMQPLFLPVSLHLGYIDKKARRCYYTDHQIFERYHKLKVRRQVERSGRMTINELNAMQIGDYIVHIDHGVGQYGGLVKTNVGGKKQEAVKLIYKDGDVIFVSIHSLHRISKFKSRDGEIPRIYKLGTKAWDTLKNNTKSKVKDIAKDLIKLYSERQNSEGFAFSPDSYLQQELESSFIYKDTPDQMKATEAIKADMENRHPMDRLVCGDVGFGKTEVAIRAAFKAVCDSKQVAVLVPTTILALQHYETFKERLKDFPCTVDYLSRLRTAKEIKEIETKIENGGIDIIIGTHRILNKNIKFKDLGLLIIDEEQKFGVTSKEKIRQMKSTVDTLTLTATPIPRTLQFSLLGARDMSIINTPPPNRIPVSTEVVNFNEEMIADIISREIERGGQVYFVHNRVEDILSIRDILHRICPEAEICVAHGKMEPKELENRVLSFIKGDYDILLSTTIIENGIDVPNANTMIVNQAHRFGLSDLHQLRGRVGRSNVKAYCYLIVPSVSSMNEDARRRIKALEAFSDLGSGFNIAMQDLDIRGAGNLLGAEQSGFMAEMGYETYMKIIKEAINEIVIDGDLPEKAGVRRLSSNNSVWNIDTQIETDLEVFIPDDYVNVPSEKIRLYKELDGINDENRLRTFASDIADRFGSPVPVPLLELMDIVRLRLVAQKLGLERIVIKDNVMRAYFVSNRLSSFYQSNMFGDILNKIQEFREYNLCEHNDKLYIMAKKVSSVRTALDILKRFLV